MRCASLQAVKTAVYRRFDANGDGRVDFRDFCFVLAEACLGPGYDRLRFLFSLFAGEGKSEIGPKELRTLLGYCWRQVGPDSASSRSRGDGPVGADAASAASVDARCDAWVDKQVRSRRHACRACTCAALLTRTRTRALRCTHPRRWRLWGLLRVTPSCDGLVASQCRL